MFVEACGTTLLPGKLLPSPLRTWRNVSLSKRIPKQTIWILIIHILTFHLHWELWAGPNRILSTLNRILNGKFCCTRISVILFLYFYFFVCTIPNIMWGIYEIVIKSRFYNMSTNWVLKNTYFDRLYIHQIVVKMFICVSQLLEPTSL